MNLDDDRPVCDFCDLMIEEDESLEPVFVGERPEPKPHRLREIADKDGRRTTRVGERELMMFGKPIGMYQAMFRALHECRDITVKEHMHVKEFRSVGGDVHFADLSEMPQGVRDDMSLDPVTRDDKVAVTIEIEPKDVSDSPDTMLCPNCAEMLREMGDD